MNLTYQLAFKGALMQLIATNLAILTLTSLLPIKINIVIRRLCLLDFVTYKFSHLSVFFKILAYPDWSFWGCIRKPALLCASCAT